PDPDIYVNPIVVARFMYVGADDSARAITKQTKLEAVWTTPAPVPDGTSWDENWLGSGNTTAATAQNTILHIAPDDISAYSTAEYGASIYYCDFSRKVYRYAYPAAPAATATPTPDPSATATPQPFTAYSPAPVGSAVDDTEKLNASDIEIVLGEGKSAKSGGLSLSEVFSILFFDWDNSFLGALTAGIGVDVTADVDRYVKSQFVHPDLRGEDYDALNTAGTITQRRYNYRGEYPYTGPAASNPTIPDSVSDYTDKLANGTNNPNAGSLYPLTNKLDYCFAGKDIDTEHPFANGWTAVVSNEPDYSDTTKFPGYMAKTLPTYMETTITSLNKYQKFGKMPELDTSGQFVDTTLTANDLPNVVTFDFESVKDLTKADLDDYYGGNIYLKAVYTPGEMLNMRAPGNTLTDTNYVAIGPMEQSTLVTTASSSTYGFSFEYRRINQYGYGVERANKPSVRMDIQQTGATSSTPIELLLTNKDVLDILLTPTNFVKTMGYQLVEVYHSNVAAGTTRSLDTELGSVNVGGPEGVGFKIKFTPYLEKAKASDTSNWFPLADINNFYFRSNSSGTAYAARTYTQAKTKLIALVNNAGDDYLNLTWYQVQYGLANNGAYVDAATAKTWCESYPKLSENAAKV
ncbi:MAG: hypothetical protein IJG16_06605, partial [Clostridia bacterium]|nr:hypothetical protein [Clostridia bacterium]